jgi:hypothetical protein
MIKGFFGQHRWLSNFWYAPFVHCGFEYDTVEHYYQARKAADPAEAEAIRNAESPAVAKRMGQEVTNFAPNMPKLRRMVMKIGVEEKFLQNNDLKQLLINTGDEYLEETNTWGDTYWGVCNGVGTNHLGFMLMDIRRSLQMDKFWVSIHGN